MRWHMIHNRIIDPRRSQAKERSRFMRTSISLCLLVLFSVFFLAPRAMAVPSYARQTGLSCNACHYTPPELNSAGRLFKLYGYVQKMKQGGITAESGKRESGLDLLGTLPLSAWFEASFTNIAKPQPGTQNGNAEFPQDISLFLAGAWSTHIGSFLQVTYDTQGDHFSMDNTDIRYAKQTKLGGKEWVLGLTLNNNPTLEDLWNSTPAWGFPFIASDVAPSPTAAPIIQGALGQDVAGLGGYTNCGTSICMLRARSTVPRTSVLLSPRRERISALISAVSLPIGA